MHPEAIRSFNKKAESLLTLVKKQENIKTKESAKNEDIFISHTFNKKDIIGEIKTNITNKIGDDLGFVFKKDNLENYGIIDNDYKEIIKLAELIQKNKNYHNILSIRFVKETLKIWITCRYNKIEKRDFISFLKSNLDNKIREYETWVPIPFTRTEKDFNAGDVFIRTISKNIIHSWINIDDIIDNSDELLKVKEIRNNIIERYQGYAAAVYKYKAEPIKAQEAALNNISDIFSILRLFSPSNFISKLVSGIYEYDQNFIESKNLFLVDIDNSKFSIHNKILTKGYEWKIPEYLISSPEMNNFLKLLINKNKNDFNKNLYDALIICSKHTLKNNIYDKLLNVFIALESILLRNNTERVQQNLAERIAFLIEKTPTGRKYIAEIIKNIYSERSKYIHHGIQSFKEREEIDKLLNITWRTFNKLSLNINNFKTKEELISSIEYLKFS